jgi:hypothetical protein
VPDQFESDDPSVRYRAEFEARCQRSKDRILRDFGEFLKVVKVPAAAALLTLAHNIDMGVTIFKDY